MAAYVVTACLSRLPPCKVETTTPGLNNGLFLTELVSWLPKKPGFHFLASKKLKFHFLAAKKLSKLFWVLKSAVLGLEVNFMEGKTPVFNDRKDSGNSRKLVKVI